MRVHALVLVFAKLDKCRKLDSALLSLNRAKGQISKICKPLKDQRISEDTGPVRPESLALLPCPHNSTALLEEAERGQAAAG